MKGPISTFYLLDTQEALDISNKVFRIQLEYILNTLQENKRLQPVLDNNEGFNIIFDKNINDNPRIRFWLTCTKEVIKSLNSDIDPSPSSISCLFVDSLEPDRVIELHLLELFGIWVDFMVQQKKPFDLSLNIKMPDLLKLGSLGHIKFQNYSKDKLLWSISYNGADILSFAEKEHIITVNPLINNYSEGNLNRDFSINFRYNNSSFEIPVNDNALCEPYYANAAIVRSESKCKQWCENVLIPAMDILNGIDEILTQECLLLNPIILPLHSGSIGFGSASSEDILGLTYLPGVDTRYDVAECFLHEALHQKLFRIETGINFFENNSPKEEQYYSPWRTDPRPLRMILHGSFVFTAIAEMWASLSMDKNYNLENGDPAFLTTFRANQSIEGIKIIKKYGVFTEVGQNLIDSIENNAVAAIDKVGPSKKIYHDVKNILKEHSDKYHTYIH